MQQSDPVLWRKRKSWFGFVFSTITMVIFELAAINHLWLGPGILLLPVTLRILLLLGTMSPFLLGLTLRFQLRKWVASGDISQKIFYTIENDLDGIIASAYVITAIIF